MINIKDSPRVTDSNTIKIYCTVEHQLTVVSYLCASKHVSNDHLVLSTRVARKSEQRRKSWGHVFATRSLYSDIQDMHVRVHECRPESPRHLVSRALVASLLVVVLYGLRI